MSKISAYSAITSVQPDDLLVVVDVHDTSMGPAGTDKKMTLSQITAVTPLSSQGADALAYGLSFWTIPPTGANNGHTYSATTLVASLTKAYKTETINKLGIWIGAAGVTSGAGINGLALYSVTGTLLGQTGDMTSAFTSTGYFEGTISGGVAVTAGTSYYFGMMHNFTGTAPGMPSAAAGANYPSIRGVLPHGFLNGQTSFPASFTPGSLGQFSFIPFQTAGT